MKKSTFLFPVTVMLLLCSITTISQNSVLSSGDWYKIATDQTGVYKITYENLIDFGIDPTAINPKNIRIYGNGNGMLPEENSEFRYDDLQEDAIFVAGEDDGVFDPEDYILFYGEGPTEWKFNDEKMLFEHQINYYSDYTYYFLTVGNSEGKRIEAQQQATQPPTLETTSFDNYYAHEEELVNLLQAGRKWYGEKIPGNGSVEFNISPYEPDLNTKIVMDIAIAGQTYETGLLKIYMNNNPIKEMTVIPVNPTSVLFGKDFQDTVAFYPPSDNFTLKFEFMAADTASVWLDFFRLNYKSHLNYTAEGLAFRSIDAVGSGNITQFDISNVPVNIRIWNVTDPLEVKNMDFNIAGNAATFKTGTDDLQEFFAFTADETLSPQFAGQVENQNLHALEPVNIIIVSYDNFTGAAQQLADFHQDNDNLSSVIVTPQQIYNEFSSGAQDVTAIRDFVKYLYDKAGNSVKPEYLLLLGRASYDYKDRIDNNTNLVPVRETDNSLNLIAAYGTDDFYGWLDNDEGTSGIVDIGIGRIPALSVSDAETYIEKVLHYSTSEETFGNWKSNTCYVADDGDNNLHLEQADSLTGLLPMKSSSFNTTKAYLDFYELVNTPEGPRYPQVNELIDSEISNGLILMNYTGHSNNNSWSQELVLTKEQIESWTNSNALPVFIIAGCCFSNFDNQYLNTGGYSLLFNPNGGAISVYSPVTLTYSSSNFRFNKELLTFFGDNGQNRTLGNMQKYAKDAIGNNMSGEVWNLLGDPALKIAFPQYKIATETINGTPVTEPLDTIHPGDQVIITGKITDNEGNMLTNFNGDIFVKVFNKSYLRSTLGNQSPVVDIMVQDSVIAEVTATVENGQFETQFTVPLNTDEEYGYLKLSFYATNGVTDASGFFSGLLEGGEPNGVEELAIGDVFKIYPTVTDDNISIVALQNPGNVEIKLLDISGKQILTVDKNLKGKGERVKLRISDLEKGMYVLRLVTENGIYSQKIIKK